MSTLISMAMALLLLAVILVLGKRAKGECEQVAPLESEPEPETSSEPLRSVEPAAFRALCQAWGVRSPTARMKILDMIEDYPAWAHHTSCACHWCSGSATGRGEELRAS